MLIKSGTITQGSGSLGGMTMAHNRGGLYLRARTLPTDPNSPRQQIARAAFTNTVQRWPTLDEGQRVAWSMWAANTPFVNALGDPIVLTGQQAYVYANQIRTQVTNAGLGTLTPVDDGPTIYSTGAAVTSVVDALTDGTEFDLTVNFTIGASPAGNSILFVGRPQNISRKFFKGPYQLAAIAPFGDGDPNVNFTVDMTTPSSWSASFTVAAGDNLPIKIVNSFNDGRLSQEWRAIVRVEATGP